MSQSKLSAAKNKQSLFSGKQPVPRGKQPVPRAKQSSTRVPGYRNAALRLHDKDVWYVQMGRGRRGAYSTISLNVSERIARKIFIEIYVQHDTRIRLMKNFEVVEKRYKK